MLLKQVLEEGVVRACKGLLHLCPVAIDTRTLLQAAYDMAQLVAHLTVVGDVRRTG